MTTEEALDFLRAHQPMPADDEITDEEADRFVAVITHFILNPDLRCVPLFLHCLTDETTLHIYQRVKAVLYKYDQHQITPYLLEAMQSANEGTRYWAVDAAIEFPDDLLLDSLTHILNSPEAEDAQMMAILALEEIWIHSQNPQVVPVLQQQLVAPQHDEATRKEIREALSRIGWAKLILDNELQPLTQRELEQKFGGEA